MGILIDLDKLRYASQQNEIEGRMGIGLAALAVYLGKHFIPQRLEIWKDTPRKEMDGQMLWQALLEAPSDSRDINRKFDEFANHDFRRLIGTVMLINGTWKIADFEGEGYFSINHAKEWRLAYGDVEADLNPDATVDDLMTVFWRDINLRRELVDKFFEKFLSIYETQNFSKRLGTKIRWIGFASGTPTRFDIRSVKAAYYGRERTLIADAFKTFRDKHAAQRSVVIDYLVEKAYEQPMFEKAIESAIQKTRVIKKPGRSIIYIAEDFDSIEKLYDKLVSDYVEPILSKLPTDNYVDGVVREEVTKHKPLDFYSSDDSAKLDDDAEDSDSDSES